MKTRLTLTALTLASALMASTSAMAAPIASGTEGHFNVRLKLTGSCEVFTVNSAKAAAISAESDATSGADIDFLTHTAQSNSPELTQGNVGGATTGIQVNCSKNTAFQVAMQPESTTSADGLGSMSGLKGGSDRIAYQLYKPTVTGAGTEDESVDNTITANKWGNGNDALSLTGKGLNTAITLPVFAKIAANQLSDKTPDTYQDRVKVTLIY